MMTECAICKKTKEEAELYQGIYENEIISVCENCAELEKIPLIKKPTKEQLQQVDRRYSVRERMEKISGMNKKMPLSREQLVANKNLQTLKFPEKKQEHEKLVQNYYWAIRMARRRKKLSLGQLAGKINIPALLIEQIERGQLPENFEQIMLQLELSLGIKLLKNESKESKIINFTLPPKSQQKEILEKVRERMEKQDKSNPHSDLSKQETAEEKEEKEEKRKENKKKMIKNIASGKFDFSKRQNFTNLTINDLVDMKKQKQKKEMFGDDLDLEMEERGIK